MGLQFSLCTSIFARMRWRVLEIGYCYSEDCSSDNRALECTWSFLGVVYLSYSKNSAVVLGFFFYYALIGAYWCIGATVGDTILLSWLFEKELSLPSILPWVYISIAVMSSATMFLFDRLQNYFDSVKLTLVSQLLMSLSLFTAYCFLSSGSLSLRFVLTVWLEASALVLMTLF